MTPSTNCGAGFGLGPLQAEVYFTAGNQERAVPISRPDRPRSASRRGRAGCGPGAPRTDVIQGAPG